MITYNGITIDRTTRTITHRGHMRRFQAHLKAGESIMFKSITYLILGGGVSRVQLFWHIYGNDRDGGPDRGPDIFCTRFHQWKEQGILSSLDIEMRSGKIAGVPFYELVPTYQIEARHARAV